MTATNNRSSYLDMDKELAARINCIAVRNLTIDQTISIIKQMYLNGADDMDTKWRKALKIFAKRYKMKYAPGILNELLNILKNI